MADQPRKQYSVIVTHDNSDAAWDVRDVLSQHGTIDYGTNSDGYGGTLQFWVGLHFDTLDAALTVFKEVEPLYNMVSLDVYLVGD